MSGICTDNSPVKSECYVSGCDIHFPKPETKPADALPLVITDEDWQMADEDRQYDARDEVSLRYRAAAYHARTRQLAQSQAELVEVTLKGESLCSTLGNLLIHIHDLGLGKTPEQIPYIYRNARAETAEKEVARLQALIDVK